jgi:hypothetical protein
MTLLVAAVSVWVLVAVMSTYPIRAGLELRYPARKRSENNKAYRPAFTDAVLDSLPACNFIPVRNRNSRMMIPK